MASTRKPPPLLYTPTPILVIFVMGPGKGVAVGVGGAGVGMGAGVGVAVGVAVGRGVGVLVGTGVGVGGRPSTAAGSSWPSRTRGRDGLGGPRPSGCLLGGAVGPVCPGGGTWGLLG